MVTCRWQESDPEHPGPGAERSGDDGTAARKKSSNLLKVMETGVIVLALYSVEC
jgi:hypothetical protein